MKTFDIHQWQADYLRTSVNETKNPAEVSQLSSKEYQEAKKYKEFSAKDWEWCRDEELYCKIETTISENETIDHTKVKQLSSKEYQEAKKHAEFLAKDWEWCRDEELYNRIEEATIETSADNLAKATAAAGEDDTIKVTE